MEMDLNNDLGITGTGEPSPFMSIEDFKAEFNGPVVGAEDAPAGPGPDPGPEFIPPPAEPLLTDSLGLTEPSAPLFGEEMNRPAAEQPVKEMAPTMAEVKLRFILSMIDTLLSKGYAKIAREVDTERWRFDEDDIEALVRAWKPYMMKHGNRIPDNLEVIFVTVWVFGRKTYSAFMTGRQNRRNEKAAQRPEVQQAVKAAAATVVERKKYEIDANGYYASHPKTGAYVKVADRKDKADLKDIEKLIRDNDLTIIKRAFPAFDTSPYEKE